MIKLLSPKKMLLILGFSLSANAFATFIDNGSSKKTNPYNNISLKNFSRNSFKTTNSMSSDCNVYDTSKR